MRAREKGNCGKLVAGELLKQTPSLCVPDADFAVDAGGNKMRPPKKLERCDGSLMVHEGAHFNLLVQIVDPRAVSAVGKG